MMGGDSMKYDYKNLISHIDIDRSLGTLEYFSFNSIDDESIDEFRHDLENGNDSIELHLIKSRAYKEALILRLKKNDGEYSDLWSDFLKEEQKTFGGSKIFYISDDCSKLLILSLPNEMKNKLNMVVTRVNKINERISRINAKIKKDNLDLYTVRIKERNISDKYKEDLINFINQNLRV